MVQDQDRAVLDAPVRGREDGPKPIEGVGTDLPVARPRDAGVHRHDPATGDDGGAEHGHGRRPMLEGVQQRRAVLAEDVSVRQDLAEPLPSVVVAGHGHECRPVRGSPRGQPVAEDPIRRGRAVLGAVAGHDDESDVRQPVDASQQGVERGPGIHGTLMERAVPGEVRVRDVQDAEGTGGERQHAPHPSAGRCSIRRAVG